MKRIIPALIFCLLLFSCSSNSNSETNSKADSLAVVEKMEFETLPASKTGIDFYNTIEENENFNFYSYEYIYNGAGVAVGDINNDGLTDIYFSGNQVQDKLYLNKGDMVFEDITETAFDEKANEGWHTGVNMVDIDGDGWLDIYVCRSGDPEDRALLQNLLFINNHDNTFTEKGAEYGVNVEKRSTHALFFDYDNDNDLDLYVLNHPNKLPDDRLVTVEEYKSIKMFGKEADVLLENKDGKFEDVSLQAGIFNNCYGLGIAASDLDGNGYMDLYISNDYQDPDLLYMNHGDGTFTQEIKERTNHISNYSMGNDIADFNNDGYPDIFTVDMAAEDHVRSKRNMGGMSTKNFWEIVSYGLHYQYMFNALQMNNGDGSFSDVAQMAGVSNTDWSWAPLFADFDNDGKKDLFVSNGYRREARDNDYLLDYERKKYYEDEVTYEEGLALMPTTKIHNYVYQNDGNIHFTKKTEDWNINAPVNSNGAAFADFDNDGDLDLVVNNMEEVSFIMENKLQTANNYVRIKVKGNGKNIDAIGAKIRITAGGQLQFHEVQFARGYESSVEQYIHFGLGKNNSIDQIEIEWPGGKTLTKKGLVANQLYTFSISEANGIASNTASDNTYFEDITDSLFNFIHKEIIVNDFESEVLMPHKMSQLGPFISKGDVNGDGLEDVYVSGAADFSGVLYLQDPEKGFVEKKGPWKLQKVREEMGSTFIDVEGDGDLDLYVVSGGNEYNYNSPYMQDQLYINDGKGNFTNESDKRLPKMEASGQRIAIADYDNDGDIDMFVGGRQMPGYYPFTCRSYLLQNDGNGVFKDATQASFIESKSNQSISIEAPGMITDALFDDFDGDDDLDLIIVGEWMPIMFYENDDGRFSDVTMQYNPDMDVGWWYSISKGDFNRDGKNDYIVGNVGANNKFHPTREKPLEIYCHDFDENGTYDIVLAKYQNNICYPVRGRQCSSEQMPFITQKFPTYSQFATADIESIYGREDLDKALHYSATLFESIILQSSENGFETKKLPAYAQMSPVNKSINMDVNGDGYLDAILVGNNYSTEVETIRYDSGRGTVLLGDGNGGFTQLGPAESGFYERNDCKDMTLISFNGEMLIITVSNRNKAKTFLLKS